MTTRFQDPTPCPQPRAGGIHRPSALGQGLTGDFTRSFRDAKPRRRTSNRPEFGWDPTVDIYDDTFDFSKPLPPHQPESGHQRLGLGQPRRTTLFRQPAQRPLPVTSSVGRQNPEEDAKRRRMSLIQQPRTGLEPIHDENITDGLTGATSEIKKNPRRRTIYVPSDDTTIMTIHPGAPLNARKHSTYKPPRWDIFADLAAVKEEDSEALQRQESRKKPSRPSLATAPRRAPLQQASHISINRSAMGDTNVSGVGKENIPPGGSLDGLKPSRRSSVLLRGHTTQATSPHRHQPKVAMHRMSVVQESNSPRKEPTLHDVRGQSIAQNDTNVVRKLARSSLMGPPQKPIERQQLLGRRLSSLNAASQAHDKPTTQQVPTRLSIPSFATRKSIAAISKYPVLAEEIHVPQLYEDNWLSHQEMAVTQLINSLFESDDSKVNKRIPAARNALLSMYQEPTMPLLYKRLQASLRFGALNIPNESLMQVARLKDDVGQRHRFLNLWLKTYNLSSLQSAAEVVVGRQVPSWKRKSNSTSPQSPKSGYRIQCKSLEAFIRTFLINNDDKIERKATTVNVSASNVMSHEINNEKSTNVAASLWRRTVLRSFMIVLLLDKAQQAGIFKGCLFQKSSPFKSSSAVIQSLSMLLLPSIGDVPRVLGHLNYIVRHVQYPLQEHDYMVSNLATDLRDGVLLARLVETLLYPSSTMRQPEEDITVTLPSGDLLTSSLNTDQGQSWVLSQHLKHPCISRIQKLYNVQISLSALIGLDGVGQSVQNTKAEDIVDGHREKTVSLLWNLVGQWGLELLLDFNLIEKELVRLKKELCQRRLKADKEGSFEPRFESRFCSAGLERCMALLKAWATDIALLHGLTVANLSTSFADGKVYNAIANEYTSALRCCNVLGDSTVKDEEAGNHVSTSTTLKALGCSQAFSDMFLGDFGMPSDQTTVPLLAFLASRLLPLSQPYFAARTIQRAWRRKQSRETFRRRVVLAYLANDCAAVVQTRERLVWAVLVLQRRWREILCKGKYADSYFWKLRSSRVT